MNTEYKQKLLTIAIPTYNRANLLNVCLSQIAKQLPGYEQLVDVMVSNNCSTDNTEELVNSYIERGVPITYFCNSENIGAEKNIIQCFERATCKYVLILGDDDLILDGALRKIIEFLRENEVGVLYLTSYGFKNDYLSEQPKKNKTGIHIFTAPEKFLEKVHYWVTFISGNVVNKSLLPSDLNAYKYLGTNLPQLEWVFHSLNNAEGNAIAYSYCIAARAENTGGFSLANTFGINFLKIIDDFIINGKLPNSVRHIISTNLLISFFPHLIYQTRFNVNNYSYTDSDFQTVLKSVFGRMPLYWINVYPILNLPRYIAKLWLGFIRIQIFIRKLRGM